MRYLLAALLLVVVVAGLGGVKFFQISKLMSFGEAAAKAGPPPEAVGTAIAQEGTWEGALEAVGTVAAARGVAISNEVPGVVKAIRFDSGAQVRAGQVLVELDSSVERAQLASLQARLDLANVSAERSRRLREQGAMTQADFDAAEASRKTLAADVDGLRAQIERKTVRAPFAGRLGIRKVNLGQYLAPGTAITVLESVGALYVDFSLPQQRLADVPVGTPVRLTLNEAGGKELTGKVAAVEPTVAENTRNVKLRAAVSSDDADRLTTGMFVNVQVVLPQKQRVVSIPSTAVVYATYGNSVYIVEPRKDKSGAVVNGPDGKPMKAVRQQFVRLGSARGDFVAVLDGVKSGDEVVSVGAFKLRNGAAVIVDNSLTHKTALNPSPENR